MTEPSISLFRPKRVFIDKAVKDLPYTQELLARLGEVKCEVVAEPNDLKVPTDLTWAKKGLLVTRYKPEPLKEFGAMTRSTGRPTYSLNLISNCHLECSYCILQSSLANNPVITVYANLDEILENLEDQLDRIPRGSVVGTGQRADSLALEELTGLHQKLIPFFASQDRVQLELKTKCADVEPLLKLKHGGQTVVSWSLAPERVHTNEEFKTAKIEDRIAAMKSCQKAGYPVGVHFDPVIHHTGWEKNYKKLIDQVFGVIDAKKVAWVSLGTLRFPSRQVKLIRERFPNNRKIFNNLVSTQNRVMHYPDRLRDAIYGRMREYLAPHIEADKIYISMEAEQTEPAQSETKP